jgi:hypothetical protein
MKYSRYIPVGTFISDYMELMKEVATPRLFDFHSALWIIGAVNEHVSINHPRRPIRLPWYTILVSASGRTERGLAVESAYEVLGGVLKPLKRRATADDWVSGCRAFTLSEADIAMGKDVHSKAFLQKLYTEEGIALLTSSTPTKLFKDCHPLLMEAEYASKFVFVCSDQHKPAKAWPKEPDYAPSRRSLEAIVSSTRLFRSRRLDINEGGIEAFSKWHRQRARQKDPERSILESGEDSAVLRYGAALAINDGTLQIQSRHIRASCQIVADLAADRDSLYNFIDVSGTGRIAEGVSKARERILSAGGDGIGERQLYQSLRYTVTSDEYKLMLRIMHEAGMVDKFMKMQPGGKRRTIFYRPANLIHRELAISHITDLMGVE